MSSTTDSLKSQPTIIFIFGGTGDLTSRKLIPALYNLYIDNWMPNHFQIVAMGRTALTDDKFRENLLNDVNKFSRSGKADPEKWKTFAKNLFYQVSDINDTKTYQEQSQRIAAFGKETGVEPNLIYYLAVAPRFFSIVADNLSKHKLAVDTTKTRIVLEKPFGHDFESAKKLNAQLGSVFSE